MDKYEAQTSQGKEAYLKALDGIGWFSLPQNDRAKTEKHLSGISNNKNFFFTLAHIVRDAEGFDDGREYKELFDEMAAMSGINVVSAEFEYKMIGFGEDELTGTVVTEKGSYKCVLEELMGWLDGDFVDWFINQEVLPKEGIESRFFMLPATDQMAQYAFMPQEMYDKAIETGILPDDPEYFMSEFE
ncbi:hypothetical protein [uncultured Flavobacterium sp.]|uniref:hypothetical protein n=1 Tax=uncultured Flavobacterium sp. TaxID=165435 RepID=UPI0025F85AC6|nr:hypothetical protein [uncultured Flavobacterium sp.]